MRFPRLIVAALTATLLATAGFGYAQEPPPDQPPVDQADVTPADPVDPPAPEPMPEPTEGEQVASAFQAVFDTLNTIGRGQGDVDIAQAAVTAAEENLARMQQQLTDAESMRDGSAATLVDHARAAIAVLEQLVAAYNPGQ